MTREIDSASFRDPDGFIYQQDGVVYRQVQQSYAENWELLNSSGLYQELSSEELLVSHEVMPVAADSNLDNQPQPFKIIRPLQIPFISYPYEWCFSQLKDAALLTLDIQKRALKRGMSLKDATSYNVQFLNGRPIFIDTLSFERYPQGQPWIAYGQFCRHFLAPLALMSRVDVRLGQLLRVYMDGLPLDLASHLLPTTTRLKPGLLTHIHLHSASEHRHSHNHDRESSNKKSSGPAPKVSHLGLQAIIDSLESTVKGLEWKPAGTEWSDYYDNTNYSQSAMDGKVQLVTDMLSAITPKPTIAWDLGANNGLFSRLASKIGMETVAWDIDPAAVEINYLQIKSTGDKHLLPLIVDLANPSADIGWSLTERKSIISRGPASVALALALIHHLAIGNNVPLVKVAAFFASITEWLIIEFVPRSDSQVQGLLINRKDIFDEYEQATFETKFSKYFELVDIKPVAGSERTLYLMHQKMNN